MTTEEALAVAAAVMELGSEGTLAIAEQAGDGAYIVYIGSDYRYPWTRITTQDQARAWLREHVSPLILL